MLKDNTYLYTILYAISNIFLKSRVFSKIEYDYLNKFLNSTKENITMEEREKRKLIDSIISQKSLKLHQKTKNGVEERMKLLLQIRK